MGREDVHPPQLAGRLVQTADAAARDRLAVLEGDEERPVRRLEVLGARHLARAGAAVVPLGQLGLLCVGHSLGERRSERLWANLQPHAARLH